ncbi:hypothetical protein NKG95_29010 [Mesorhizobium sp. M1423]|uniref:hypothetical protein n=1 Tax=unclassified Mesorhizobium TaxID=325217 RepID=UPI00333936FD
MSRASISLSDLRRYADKLPDFYSPDRPRYYKVAVMPRMVEPYAYYDARIDRVDIQTIEFHCRETHVDGVRALAWYYHDILVKVAV